MNRFNHCPKWQTFNSKHYFLILFFISFYNKIIKIITIAWWIEYPFDIRCQLVKSRSIYGIIFRVLNWCEQLLFWFKKQLKDEKNIWKNRVRYMQSKSLKFEKCVLSRWNNCNYFPLFTSCVFIAERFDFFSFHSFN